MKNKDVSFNKDTVIRNVAHTNINVEVEGNEINFKKEDISKSVKNNDFHIGSKVDLGNILKEKISKTFESREVHADSTFSTEVLKEIDYEHNLTDEQLERE